MAISTTTERGPARYTRPATTGAAMPGEGAPEPGFLAEAELQRRDRDRLIAVLKTANWKIKGRDGAAELLGVNSATFLARTKK